MFKTMGLLKKVVIALLVHAVALAAFPISGASAAGLNAQPDNTRLEALWAREQAVYQREGDRLANASTWIARAQTLIDKAKAKGRDTTAVQAALNALSAVIPAVQAAHAPGAAIIAGHDGFDPAGKVTDRTAAITTVKSLAKVLKDTRTAMDGTGKALREAIRAFRAAHPRKSATPVQ